MHRESVMTKRFSSLFTVFFIILDIFRSGTDLLSLLVLLFFFGRLLSSVARFQGQQSAGLGFCRQKPVFAGHLV